MMRYSVFIFLCFVYSISLSQNVKILDKETGKSIRNVTVFNDSNTISLTSNNDGFVDISSIK